MIIIHQSKPKICPQLSNAILVLLRKYEDAFLLIGGDFNDAPDDFIDRFPPNSSSS